MPRDGDALPFKRNPFIDPNALTLADVQERLVTCSELSGTRVRDLRSAIGRLATLLDRDAAMIPADAQEIAKGLQTVNPVQHGLNEKTFQNIKSNVLSALRVVKVHTAPQTARTVLNASWQGLFDQFQEKRFKSGLSRLAHFCSAEEITPEDVSDDTIDLFMQALEACTFHQNPRELHRRTTRLWNEAVDAYPDWPRQRLRVPSFRKPRQTIPLSGFPPSFQEDVKAHLEWMSDPDLFAEHRPSKPNKPGTIKLRRKYIELAASAQVQRGRPIIELMDLAALVEPEAVKEVLRHYIDKSKESNNRFVHSICAAMISIAQHWVRVDDAQLAQLKDLRRRLRPERIEFSAKNKDILRQFDDDTNLRRLLELPEVMFNEALAEADPGQRAAIKAQIAIAIESRLMAPIRMAELIGVTLDTHLLRPGGPNGLIHLVIGADEVKNEQPIEYELPNPLTDMIDVYVERFRPLLTKPDNVYLFPDRAHGHKAQATLSQQIKETVWKRTGLYMRPHAFRHLAAKLLYQNNPGDHEGVRQLLGHKSAKTTALFYLGLNTILAGKRHDALIGQERERLKKLAPRGRRRKR